MLQGILPSNSNIERVAACIVERLSKEGSIIFVAKVDGKGICGLFSFWQILLMVCLWVLR
jgi:hypothetical protein